MKLSIVIPVYNEQNSLIILADSIRQVLRERDLTAEIIFVDDGSSDKSLAILKDLAERDKNIKVISFKRNFGQTAALAAGIKFASGDIIIPMDSDLENDPQDIWPLLQKLDEGYDLVSGWRQGRWGDKVLTRQLPSYLANKLISAITGVKLNDYGCTLKAYRREILEGVNLYGEMHRFIPVYACQSGARIAELKVKHHPRRFGQTKYNVGRVMRVLLDLLTVKFLHQYSAKPMHFFGGFGFASFALGLLSLGIALYLKFIGYASLIQTPLPLLGAFLFLIGLQFILMGLLAEMIMRNYYESQNKTYYLIKDKINFED